MAAVLGLHGALGAMTGTTTSISRALSLRLLCFLAPSPSVSGHF
jgi:hypothetical protein